MFYFREAELQKLQSFYRSRSQKAMAVYGRRRAGKTALLLQFTQQLEEREFLYFQCASYDYNACLNDFASVLKQWYPEDTILSSLQTFRDVFTWLGRMEHAPALIIIDEFPFLCHKNEDAVVEFQWIIDNALAKEKLILLGSNLSFMKRQLNDQQAPLYGRFDEIIEVLPFSFHEVNTLYPDFEDAVNVYAKTGGVAQYVTLYHDFDTVEEADRSLYFHKDGRLIGEAGNLLMQELRDITTYVSILRAISGSPKDSGQIATKASLDPRGIFSYLNRLMELDIVSEIDNVLSDKKHDRRFGIKDMMFRFHYTFIEPNLSMITAIGENSVPYILDNRYSEYLGFIYEDIIRESMFRYALNGILPFMPRTVGKWWGNAMTGGEWTKTDVDLVAFDNQNIVVGECKYRNKLVGMNELTLLKEKAAFIPVKGRNIYYLLASKSGFTEELLAEKDVVLIHRV